jgi:hypothetical protein
VERPLPVHEGGRVPSQPLPEGFSPVHVVHAALAVGYEIGGDEFIHGVEVAPCKEILEPAPDDAYVLWRRYGVAPLSCLGAGSAGDLLPVALPVVVAPGDEFL